MKTQARALLAALAPADANSVFRATATAVKHGLYDEALAPLESAAKRHSRDARIWQMLGLAHRGREDSVAARDAFAKAAQLAPGDPLIAHSLARVTMEAGFPAADLFARAVAMAPDDGAVRQGYAAALFAESRMDEAIAMLDAALARSPAWTAGHETATRLRWMRGDGNGSTVTYERALAAEPGRQDLWQSLISLLLQGERFDEALTVIARARAALGPQPILDGLDTVCVAERGDIEAADRGFARLGPIRHVSMAVRYARHLLRAGRALEAAAFAERWIDADPDFLMTPYLAVAWRLTGDARWQWLEGDPRLIGVYDIGARIGALDALAARLRTLHLATRQPLDQTVRGGTQTDGPLFARAEPEIRALREAIVEAVEAHVAQLPAHDPRHPLLAAPRGPIRFAGSWSVRLSDAGFHVNHVHPAGWLSSAFYVALPDGAIGGDRHDGWLTLGEATELGLDLPPIRLIEPKPGRLVLFPSTMWHGTRPFAAGERLTVAFDVARPND